MGFSVTFHHMGLLCSEPKLQYKGGGVYMRHELDPEKWSLFEALGILGELGYKHGELPFDDRLKLWWKGNDTSIEAGLRELKNDDDATTLVTYVVSKGCVADIYVEHPVEDTAAIAGANDKGKGILEEEADVVHEPEYSTDGSVKGIYFEDSEEEREFGDDGFDLHGMGDAKATLNANIEHMKKSRQRMGTSSYAHQEDEARFAGQKNSRPKPGSGTSNSTPGMAASNSGASYLPRSEYDKHVLEDDYNSEELDSADSDSDNDVRRPKVNMFKKEEMCSNYKFKLGMEFRSLKEFKEAVLEHSVLNGKSVKFVKNDAERVRIICKQNCGFKMLVSKDGNFSTSFKMKTLIDKHQCGRTFVNKNAKSVWVASQIVDKLRVNNKLKLAEIIEDIRIRFSTGITRATAIQAREIAKKLVEGDAVKQYSQLWSFADELRRVNPGNTCKLQLDRPDQSLQPRFGSFYMCLDGCKKAFKAGCRPFIGVDGCHLKGKFGGQLLCAVGRDPNDQYFPLAFAVVETESKETWRWFLTLLLEDIGDVTTNRWVFISDQQKGLIPVFEELLEGVEHRFCLRHLYSNFKKKFGGGTMIRDLMMGAAKATYVQAWEEKMNQVKELNGLAYEWLAAISTKAWCKHAFSYYPKCDVLMNNLSESFNATILLARELPILSMFQWIRTYIMHRFAALNEKMARYQGDVCPKPRRRLDREIEYSGHWLATFAGGEQFEVAHTIIKKSFVVDLEKHTCSCNFWELVGIPCRHAVAAITLKGDKPESYVHTCYKREAYQLCYGHSIDPINGEDMWPKTQHEDILPPSYKRGPGRPKKLRRRDPIEQEGREGQRSRINQVQRCTRCNQRGHNVRRCTIPPPPPPTQQEGAQPEQQEDAQPVQQEDAQPEQQQGAQPEQQQDAQPEQQQGAQPEQQQDAQPVQQESAQPEQQESAQPQQQCENQTVGRKGKGTKRPAEPARSALDRRVSPRRKANSVPEMPTQQSSQQSCKLPTSQQQVDQVVNQVKQMVTQQGVKQVANRGSVKPRMTPRKHTTPEAARSLFPGQTTTTTPSTFASKPPAPPSTSKPKPPAPPSTSKPKPQAPPSTSKPRPPVHTSIVSEPPSIRSGPRMFIGKSPPKKSKSTKDSELQTTTKHRPHTRNMRMRL